MKKGHDKDGAAIVLVVGLLAMLMLMAVAFSISMRIERKGASHYRFGVQARHMAQCALTEAIYDINMNLDTGFGATNFAIYPEWDALACGEGDTNLTTASLVTREAEKFVPRWLLGAVKAGKPRWREIKVKRNVTSGDEVVRGRYSYLVANCSGLLDANFAGGTYERAYGTSPGELSLAPLSTDIADKADFLADRKRHMRYETLPELDSLNEGLWAYSQSKYVPFHLMAYSLGKEGQYLGAAEIETDKVDLSGDVSELESRSMEIVDALEESGVTDGNVVFSMLLDYIDEDSVPRDLGGPHTEAVPMINEVSIENGAASVNEGSFTLSLEWFYPFVNGSTNSYDLDAEISGKWENITTGAEIDLAAAPINWHTPSGYNPGDTVRFHVLSTNFVTSLNWSSGNVVRLTIDLKAQMQQEGGVPVDAVPWPEGNDALTLTTADATILGTDPVAVDVAARECVDPRFNWDTTPDVMWYDTKVLGGSSLFTTNAFTIGYFDIARTEPRQSVDQGTDMYVADRGYLLSVGELGRVLRGDDTGHAIQSNPDYFKTIRLAHHESAGEATGRRDEVMNKLTVRKGAYRGLVNLNTANTNVLRSVFDELPLASATADRKLDDTELATVVDAILDLGAFFYDVGELGEIVWRNEFPDWTDLERESIIVNSDGLLTVRHNLFIVLIKVESYSRQIGGERAAGGTRLSGTHAVAEVWRDPFRDADGNHQNFVRYFELLEQ